MNSDPGSSPQPAVSPPRSRATLAWLVLAQIVAALTLVPWLYLAALSALELQSSQSSVGKGLPVLLLLYPLVPIACSVAAWRFHAARRYGAAALAMPVPVVVMVGILYWLYGAML